MLDWIEDHKEKGFWYMITFASGFAFGFVTSLLMFTQVSQYLLYAFIGGASTVFLLFISVEASKHVRNRR